MIYTPQMNNGKHIFVFGSNLAGVHGAGAARDARLYWGARVGVGLGLQGQSYAIPTKDDCIITLPLDRIEGYVKDFNGFATANPDLSFLVTAIGCGLAGYRPDQIAPMFSNSPKNCILPDEFKHLLK
jgi:hypothetical protein